jgi:hypothetical protein
LDGAALAEVEALLAVVELLVDLVTNFCRLGVEVLEHFNLHSVSSERVVALVDFKFRRTGSCILVGDKKGVGLEFEGWVGREGHAGELLDVLVGAALVNEFVSEIGLAVAFAVFALAHFTAHFLALVAGEHDFLAGVFLAVGLLHFN